MKKKVIPEFDQRKLVTNTNMFDLVNSMLTTPIYMNKNYEEPQTLFLLLLSLTVVLQRSQILNFMLFSSGFCALKKFLGLSFSPIKFE